jgi:quercetin dioxygenase-like cupin family protein
MVKTKELNALVDLLDSGGVAPVEVDGQPILCVSVYETARSQAEMYLLRPGQRIPPHKHSAIDDVFVGVRGRGRIRTWDAAGKPLDHMIDAGTVLVVEPGNPHEVSCAGDDFCYVLTQSPKEQYDSVIYSAPEPVAS